MENPRAQIDAGRITFAGLCLAAVLSAVIWRGATLGDRVMHGDEAVQAMRVAALIESGMHPFDPEDQHGPLLHYLSAAQHLLMGRDTAAAMTEASIRALPFSASIVLYASPLILWPLLRFAAFPVMVALAWSPAVFFHAGYFIQEPLLALCSTLAVLVTVRQGLQRDVPGFAVIVGVLVGAMLSLKLTSLPLALALLAGAFVIGRRHAAVALVTALLTTLLVYTGFLRSIGSVMQLGEALLNLFTRASTGGDHAHPVGFLTERLMLSEWPMLVLVIVVWVTGLTMDLRPDRWLMSISAAGVALLTLHCVVPYKTPWLLLTPIVLLIVGIGATITQITGSRRWIALMAMAVLPLLQFPSLHRWNTIHRADPRNPWVYAHTVSSVPREAERIRSIAAIHPREALIAVTGADYWPYPWYLRTVGNVGYWPGEPPAMADIVITPGTGPLSILPTGYASEYIPLRPEVPLLLHVRQQLWKDWLRSRHDD